MPVVGYDAKARGRSLDLMRGGQVPFCAKSGESLEPPDAGEDDPAIYPAIYIECLGAVPTTVIP